MKTLLKKQAILDIILIPEHEDWRRVVNYNHDTEKNCDYFKIDNGQGDHLLVLFSRDGALIKGFDHESCLSPYQNEENLPSDGLYNGVPASLLQLLETDDEEDAEWLEKENVTFCLWRMQDDADWHRTTYNLPDWCWEPDGSQPEDGGEAYLMSYIFAGAEEWYEWASIHYELREEAWDAAALLYEEGEITQGMVDDLNPDRDYENIVDECEVKGLL